MNAMMCGALVILVSLLSATAEATWPVRFMMDVEFIAELEADSPFSGPMKLAGRSGAAGDDERAGLYDNLSVCFFWDAHGFCYCGDYDCGEFYVLDTSLWQSYGGPSPQLVQDFGNPAPCLMTAGDSSYVSGLYSSCAVDLAHPGQDDWYFFVDVYVDSVAESHSFEFGIADADLPTGLAGQEVLGHVVGITWTGNPLGESVLECVTDIDREEVLLDPCEPGWHRIGFGGAGFSSVEQSSWGRIKAIYR